MQSREIRKCFLAFFEKRGHAIVPSASLVPQDDPSVLFTTAGMQPLVPYLLGAKHPAGKRIVNIQKCVRTQDIEEVGDKTHDTFFEMFGNWSLGDPSAPDGIGRAGYFKEDAIKWSYEFLTSKEEGLNLDPKRLYITVFGGNENAPKDEESYNVWKSVGIPDERIYFMEGKLAEKNWWSPGDNGPCGPDTEIFYDVMGGVNLTSLGEFLAADEKQQVVEIWNDVFMEYEKKDGKVIGKLENKNVDTGGGLERFTMATQDKDNIFDTDLFKPLMDEIDQSTTSEVVDLKAKRIVADHIRSSVFIIADGVTPSNTDRGYILRRLLRRAVRYADTFGIKGEVFVSLADVVIEKYKDLYKNLAEKREIIKSEIQKEEQKFRKTLERGFKELEKIQSLDGEGAFNLYQTYGFPFELTKEIAKEKGIPLDEEAFNKKFTEHQTLSRTGALKKFKGGLAGHSLREIQYHTTTHLLHQALRTVLGNHVFQKGSNITPERLRFDFSHTGKLTDEEKKRVEDLVNEKIQEDLPVSWSEMAIDEARKKGAIGLFDENYGEKVKVYKIGNEDSGIFSLEFCGGPHVEHTGQIGKFKIIKEEAVAEGVRRIKAIVE